MKAQTTVNGDGAANLGRPAGQTGRPGQSSGAIGAAPLITFLPLILLTAVDSSAMSFDLLPAVDVAGGRAVRMTQGRVGSETFYGSPLQAALAFQAEGAHWLHLVDIDAAFGRGANTALLAEVVGALDIHVELSGGIRDDASLAAALDTGCARVNIGTAALEDPDWCAAAIARHGDRIAIGLDVRATTLSGRGWTRDGGDLWEVLARLDSQDCARYVVTDVNRDGMLGGPGLALLQAVCAATVAPVVASGGVSSLADLQALAALAPIGVEGAIVGKALYAGAFTLTDALAAVSSAPSPNPQA